jgi:hypothetical protein
MPKPEPIVFLKTGWMDFYDGRADDEISGAFEHIQTTGSGHEDRNFKKQGQYCYGYAPFNNKTMDLHAHFDDADETGTYVDNVTVVWISKAPDKRRVVVVGWYEHARLYASYHRFNRGRVCLARARIGDCKLIAADYRQLRIDPAPRNTNVWYADDREALKRDIRSLIAGTYRPPLQSGHRRSTPDRSQILAVEIAAINAVWDYYEERQFTVKSVEKENLGWDLVATQGDAEFRIEVKGTSQDSITAELTPNEYAMALKHKNAYRICIVTEALSVADVHVFKFSDEVGEWMDEMGRQKLRFQKIVGARLRI